MLSTRNPHGICASQCRSMKSCPNNNFENLLWFLSSFFFCPTVNFYQKIFRKGQSLPEPSGKNRFTKSIILFYVLSYLIDSYNFWDWDSAVCVTNYQLRLTSESWYTNSLQEPLNRCQQLPIPYEWLVHDFKRNQQTIDGLKITATTTNQSLQLSSFDKQSHHDKTDLREPRPET